MKDKFDLLIEKRLYNEFMGFGRSQQTGNTDIETPPDWYSKYLNDDNIRPINKKEVMGMMQDSLNKINQILNQGEQRIRNSIKQMASQHNFSTQRGYASKPPQPPTPQAVMQQQTNGSMGFMQKEHYDSELFEIAEVFETLALQNLEYANELANHAHYANSMLAEYMVDPAQMGVSNASGSAAQAGQTGQMSQTPQMGQGQDDLNKMFKSIKQSIVGEFRKLLQYLNQKNILA